MGDLVLSRESNPGAVGANLTTIYVNTSNQLCFVAEDGVEHAFPVNAGNVSSTSNTSVDSEIALFSGTGGVTIKRSTGNGIAKLTSGVLSLVTAPTGNLVGDTDGQTLTNKTLTLPIISSSLNGGNTITYPSTGNVTLASLTGVETMTNKRITKRVSSTANIGANLSWNSDNFDMYIATAQAANLTINADSGSPTSGQQIVFRFKDNGNAQTLTWTTGANKSFRAVGVTLPTTTVASKTLYVGSQYNADDLRWDVIATAQEA